MHGDPTSLIAPDPVYGRRCRERVAYPRFAGVQDDSVGCRKGAQSLFDLGETSNSHANSALFGHAPVWMRP